MPDMGSQLTLQALENMPVITPGDDLAVVIGKALSANGLTLQDGDILVLAQKIVSKAAGLFVDLKTVEPGEKARELAQITDKDPRLVELILGQSRSVIRQVPGVLITEHNSGWIMANAGIDASNVSAQGDEDQVLLLPEDPDQACRKLRDSFRDLHKVDIGVLINDSFGRPWRHGTTGVAIGADGIACLWDRRGQVDLNGRALKVSQQAIGDELAAAASLLQGQGDEGKPVVVIRGYTPKASSPPPARPAADLIRAKDEDLFR